MEWYLIIGIYLGLSVIVAIGFLVLLAVIWLDAEKKRNKR